MSFVIRYCAPLAKETLAGVGRPSLRFGGVAVALLALGGCATLPSNGPTASTIMHGAMDGSAMQYRIEDIASLDASIFDAPPQFLEPSLLVSVGRGQIVRDAVQPGDVLQIRIYEIGISLFSGPASTTMAGSSNDLTAHNESFPNIVVDDDGTISLPYLGRLNVAGLSVRDVQRKVRHAMQGRSQSADIMVSRTDSPGTSFSVAGDVRHPGIFPLGPGGRTLLNAILDAGGQANPRYDETIRFTRNAMTRTIRLSQIDPADPGYNIAMSPGDRIEIEHQPLTYLSMGAGGKVAQIPFEAEHLSLAEAIAKLGGPSDNQANPRAVFLFRTDPMAKVGEPLNIYRIDMTKPASYIISQKIEIKDKDLIYIANASANLPAKFVSIINQLFSPVVTLRAISN